MIINGLGSFDWPSNASPLLKTNMAANPTPASVGQATGDSVDISSVGRGFNINDSLTTEDKKLVIAATGGLDLIGPNGTHQINFLAMQIALDRHIGNLTGPVTASYINGLKNSERQTLSLNQQYAATLFAGGNSKDGQAIASQGPGISLDVLDKALTILAKS